MTVRINGNGAITGLTGLTSTDITSTDITSTDITTTDITVSQEVTADSLKLLGSTSGCSRILAPAVAYDQDFSLPGTGGTFDRLERAGNILQVKSFVKTDTASVTGYNWTDTGLSVDITPTSTTSNVLIMFSVHLGGSNSYDSKVRLMRDSTVIGVGSGEGGRPAGTAVLNIYDSTSYGFAPVCMTYLDTDVSTTSQVTYKLQMASYSTQIVYLNRNGTFQNLTEYDTTPISTITIMEVAS